MKLKTWASVWKCAVSMVVLLCLQYTAADRTIFVHPGAQKTNTSGYKVKDVLDTALPFVENIWYQ